MITKLNLMQSAAARFENNPEFWASSLKTYCGSESLSETELLIEFNCSVDNYYKLALCKVPDIKADDFDPRLKVISEYTNIAVDHLTTVIKRVNTIRKFTGNPSNVLMAARDKEDGKNKKK